MMKKLKQFQKFALSAEQASSVRGGYMEGLFDYSMTCHYGGTHERQKKFTQKQGEAKEQTQRRALAWCSRVASCGGCA